jgi:drug/metabolite transporter (DMT)-like permease
VLLFGYVTTWYSGLKLIPVTVATSILLLGAPITSLLSLVTAGKISFQELASGALIFAGALTIVGISFASREIKLLLKKYVRT